MAVLEVVWALLKEPDIFTFVSCCCSVAAYGNGGACGLKYSFLKSQVHMHMENNNNMENNK